MAQLWTIHSRDRTLGPWTSIQVRDELRAGRIDPFDMACKDGSSVKRPLVEVDEIFQSSRVQMGEILSDPDQSNVQVTSSTKRATGEPQPMPAVSGASPQTIDRPRPSQFQALAAATRINPPGRENETRKPKQYFVTDSTGRSFGPLSSGEVMSLWHQGRVDSRAIVERASSSRRIPIRRFVDFYQKAAPSGLAFLQTRAAQPLHARYVTVVQDSAPKPLVWLAIILAVGALMFLGLNMRDHLPTRFNKYLPHISKAPKVSERFDLNATDSMTPRRTPLAAISPAQPLTDRAIVSKAVTQQVPNSHKSQVAKHKSQGRNRPMISKYTPPPATVRPSAVAPRIGYLPKIEAARLDPVIKALRRPKAEPALVDGSTVTLSGYKFAAADLAKCSGKCKIAMTGPKGAVIAVFFKEAIGKSFEGKSAGISLSGLARKQASGTWQIIVSSAQ